jgi:hypothetical protein
MIMGTARNILLTGCKDKQTAPWPAEIFEDLLESTCFGPLR